MWKSYALGLAAAPLSPLAAQAGQAGDARQLTVEEAFENEQQVYGVLPSTEDCVTADQDSTEHTTVVCGKKPDDSRYRVKSTAELDPNSRAALYDGLPRAPDLGPPPCTGVCIKMGAAPQQVHLIDLSKIPMPAPGSDADKIRKGEMTAP
jgi:hypothetical protein